MAPLGSFVMQYIYLFYIDNFIDGKSLIELTESDVKELIPEIGLRHKFIAIHRVLVSIQSTA